MSDFIISGDHGEHLIPAREQDQHCPHDFCECSPVVRLFNGRWMFVHPLFDDSEELIEQAEAIRQVVSIQLWRDIEGKNIKHKVMPFPTGFQGATWPQPANKRK